MVINILGTFLKLKKETNDLSSSYIHDIKDVMLRTCSYDIHALVLRVNKNLSQPYETSFLELRYMYLMQFLETWILEDWLIQSSRE